MGLLTNRVERNEIKPGDHIYTYRAVFTYSHHGIFVGGSKVVHFRPERNCNPVAETSSNSDDPTSSPCPTFPDCGYRQPTSGVVLSCLDCFLRKGSIYCFQYGVSPSVFVTRIRGGTCTTAFSDPPQTVIHRAMYLLQNGFGNYDVFQNNCEDFAMYCKTGLLIIDGQGVGRSGQASTIIGAPLAAMLSSPLKLLMPSPVGMATVTAGMYCMSRYATDIGVRSDVIKVAVEDLAVNLGWDSPTDEVAEDESSDRQIIVLNSAMLASSLTAPTISLILAAVSVINKANVINGRTLEKANGGLVDLVRVSFRVPLGISEVGGMMWFGGDLKTD